MSEEVTIEPQYIGDFVGHLGQNAYVEDRVKAGKDPAKKLGKKEMEELRVISAIVSTAISKGLILAKHQPELADALVEWMNRNRPGYADELLSDMLFQYKAFLYYEHFVK